MADASLVGPDLEVGKELVDYLSQHQFPLKAAAWVHDTAAERWRLYLVTPVRNRDLLEAYIRASATILENQDRKDEWKQIPLNIVDVREPFGRRLIELAKDTRREYRRVSDATPYAAMEAYVYRAAA